VGAIHRKVRERWKDLLHQLSHRLTAKAGVLKIETLNVKGMARNRHLALSVADAGMSRLLTFCAYKADWRGLRIVAIDPWFAGSQTCCQCGQIHREMRKLSVRMMVCACGNVMGRDRNAAVNHLQLLGGTEKAGRPRPYARGDWRSGACSGAGR
jgi:putative transposase